jgi:hypothetical protein
MPEPNVLYGVTLMVVLGLLAWVAYVLKTAKEPWARPVASVAVADAPLVTEEEPAQEAADEPAKAAEKVDKADKAEEDAEAEKAEEPAKADKAD